MYLCGLTILSIVVNTAVKAQSTIPQRDMWAIGTNVVKFDLVTGALQSGSIGTLPIHADTYFASAEPQLSTSTINNAYHDENGNLLFYIADSKVYDYEGRFIGALMYEPGPGLPQSTGGSGEPINGHKEIAIVPDKCNPRVFYIVAGNRLNNSHNGSTNFDSFNTPKYTKLEIGLNINSITAGGGMNSGNGDPLADGRLGFSNDYFVYVYGAANAPYYIGAPMHSLVANPLQNNNEPLYSLAVSKVQADGNRLLFVGTGNEVAIFTNAELATSGEIDQLSVPASLYSNLQFGNQNPNVELELFQATNSNVIRMANKHPSGDDYFYNDFSYAAGVITPSSPIMLDDQRVYSGRLDYGLEFSPNGRYLYFTNNLGLAYFDLNQTLPVAVSLATQVNINTANFNQSQIEVGKDDALYFCNGSKLGRLININNPTTISSGNFTTFNLPNTVPQAATSYNFDSNVLGGFLYNLNDQVDGEPAYPAFVVGNTLADAKCCIEHRRYDADVHNLALLPAQGTFGSQNHNQTWSPGALNNPFGSVSGTVVIKDRLVIPAGYTVTINNMIFEYKPFLDQPNNTAAFVDGAKCVLERSTNTTDNGGQLTLNNTIFRAFQCYYSMWDGVEVQGEPSALQQVITSPPLSIKIRHGKLVINSGSIIQDAYFGAANYQFDLTNGNSSNYFKTPVLQSGGIIIGTANSTFRNNYIGVCFMPYFTANVLSNFKNTNFLVNAPLGNPLIAPYAMALLTDTKILQFKSCTFLNSATLTYPIVPTLTAPGFLHGILAYNSSLYISSSINSVNVPFITGCTFENLTYGIRAFNTTVNTILVQSSNFLNNYHGSYFSGYNGSSTTVAQRNRYFVYQYPTGTPASQASYGHYLDYCNNFKVQENRFYYNSYNETTGALVAGKYNALGCIINEENSLQTCFGAGYQGDEVYKNLFKEINIGTQAQGFNAEQPKNANTLTNGCYVGVVPAPEHNVGLKYNCNTFSGTDENDITVMYDAVANKPGRIAFQQGGGTSTGNVHSHVTTPFNCTAFNALSEREQYIDKTGINNTNPNYLESVYNNAATEKLFCFSPFVIAPNTGSTLHNTGVKSVTFGNPNTCPNKVDVLNPGFMASTSDYNNLTSLIKSAEQPLIKGDALDLTNVMNNGTTAQIGNDLLAQGSFLSDRALLAAVRKGLPPVTLKDIILLNSPVTETVKNVLDSILLPEDIRKEINNAQTGTSQRRIQEALLANLRDQQHSLAIDAMTALLLDSIYRKPEEINKLVVTLSIADANGQKVKTYLNYNDVVNAQKELDTLLVKKGSADPQCAYLQSLVDIYRDQQIGGLGLVTNAKAEATILALSGDHNEFESRGAIGLLLLNSRSTYQEWIQGKPGSEKARLAQQTDNEESTAVIENLNFKVYPNPSTGLFYYEYNAEENNNEPATLTVIDMLGKVLINGTINQANAKGMINLSELNNGIYFITISNSKKQLFTNKLSVIK